MPPQHVQGIDERVRSNKNENMISSVVGLLLVLVFDYAMLAN
jgi:hypothetical protein